MPYSASRGLLYSAPPSHESNRQSNADEEATDEIDATPSRADDPEVTTEATPTPADD